MPWGSERKQTWDLITSATTFPWGQRLQSQGDISRGAGQRAPPFLMPLPLRCFLYAILAEPAWLAGAPVRAHQLQEVLIELLTQKSGNGQVGMVRCPGGCCGDLC